MKKLLLLLLLGIIVTDAAAQAEAKVKSFGNSQYMWRYTMWKTHTNKKDWYLYHQNKRLTPILVTQIKRFEDGRCKRFYHY